MLNKQCSINNKQLLYLLIHLLSLVDIPHSSISYKTKKDWYIRSSVMLRSEGS